MWYGEVRYRCFAREKVCRNLLRCCLEDAQSGGSDGILVEGMYQQKTDRILDGGDAAAGQMSCVMLRKKGEGGSQENFQKAESTITRRQQVNRQLQMKNTRQEEVIRQLKQVKQAENMIISNSLFDDAVGLLDVHDFRKQ
jgi:hypothetical protein